MMLNTPYEQQTFQTIKTLCADIATLTPPKTIKDLQLIQAKAATISLLCNEIEKRIAERQNLPKNK